MKRPNPSLTVAAAVALVAAGLTLAPAPLPAWTPRSQEAIAEIAARLAPPDLYRQIVKNRNAYYLGAVDPFKTPLADHTKYPDGSGRLDAAIAQAVENAVRTIQGLRPFNEICYRLGVVAHYLADANDPLLADGSDPNEPAYADDYRRYVENAEPRLQVVFYGFRRDFHGRRDLPGLIEESLRRTRSLYPLVGREYRRIDYGSGMRAFDDRSTAYAVASLSMSHAVSDIAEVFRAIWIEAGGIDARPRIPVRGEERVRIPKSTR